MTMTILQDDLESLEAILSWRDEKARHMGLTDFDLRLVKLDKVVKGIVFALRRIHLYYGLLIRPRM